MVNLYYYYYYYFFINFFFSLYIGSNLHCIERRCCYCRPPPVSGTIAMYAWVYLPKKKKKNLAFVIPLFPRKHISKFSCYLL